MPEKEKKNENINNDITGREAAKNYFNSISHTIAGMIEASRIQKILYGLRSRFSRYVGLLTWG